uniref:(northern house mosquito) hypothetical protein n=1 Tax=Culex pipiens TaxID=7175 RepID=A0A8D8FCP5_CULPI
MGKLRQHVGKVHRQSQRHGARAGQSARFEAVRFRRTEQSARPQTANSLLSGRKSDGGNVGTRGADPQRRTRADSGKLPQLLGPLPKLDQLEVLARDVFLHEASGRDRAASVGS